jgi:HEAT repeat protein
MPVLNDGDERVRDQAAITLGRIGDPALDPLLDALQDEAVRVRKAAAMGLIFAFDPVGSSVAGQTSRARIEDPETRAMAATLLIRAALDEDVAPKARNALLNIGEPAMNPLLDALQDDDVRVREVAAHAMQIVLPAVRDPEIRARAVGPLIRALHDTDREEMTYVPDALAKIGEPAFEPLLEFVQRPDIPEHVRALAAFALSRIVGPREDAALARRAMQPLIDRLQDEAQSADARAHAACSLGDIVSNVKDPEIRETAVASLVAALEEADGTDQRERFAWALTRIGTEEAREAVRNAGFDPDRTHPP